MKTCNVIVTREEVAPGQLPAVCIRCGQAATERIKREFRKSFGEVKPWSVIAPFCETHKNHWLIEQLLLPTSLVLLMVLGCAGGIALPDDTGAMWLVPGLTAIVLWCFLAYRIHGGTIHARSMTEDALELCGVAPAFADALRKKRLAGVSEDALQVDPAEPDHLSESASLAYLVMFFLLPLLNIMIIWILYYSWLKDTPTRARQIRRLGILTFTMQLLLGLLIYGALIWSEVLKGFWHLT